MKWREVREGTWPNDYTLWRGRKNGYTLEVVVVYRGLFNETDVSYYYFLIHHKKTDECYNSLWKSPRGAYKTLEEAQVAAEAWVDNKVKEAK